MLKVSGRVYESESGTGLSGLHVKAVDKDLLFDDVLGTAVTDANGRFEIVYDVRDFRELFEKTPDLYVVVRDKLNQRTLSSSERNVRWKAGVDEYVDIPIPRNTLDDPNQAVSPYGPEKGRVALHVTYPTGSNPPKLLRVFLTEHLPALAKQHVFSLPGDRRMEVDVPSGEYSLQAVAPEFETMRALVNVVAGKTVGLEFSPAPRTTKARTFAEVLASYGINAQEVKPGPLDVKENSVKVLDCRAEDTSPAAFKMLEAKSIAELKAWTGSDDRVFGHTRPVFGRLPDAKVVAGLMQPKRDLRRLGPEEVEAVKALSKEYIAGNSQSVAKYAPLLNDMIAATKNEARIKIPMYFFTIVTVGPGATLQLGNGSTLFACDVLRVHATGTVKAVNNVTIKVGTYQQYS